MKRLSWIAVLAALPLTSSLAHHALEYIDAESYSTSRKGEYLFHLHFDAMSDDKNDPRQDHWEITPGIAYGITDRLMVDAHVHYASFENGLVVEERQAEFEPLGPSPFLEAAAFTVQYRITDGAPVEVAVSATYEIPFSRAEDLLGSEEVYEGTLILAREFGTHGNVTLNLTHGVEGDEDFEEYALGVKNALTDDPHGVAAGIEVLGDFDEIEESWSVLPGVYLPLNPQTILKTGLELGKDMDSTRFSLSLMHTF